MKSNVHPNALMCSGYFAYNSYTSRCCYLATSKWPLPVFFALSSVCWQFPLNLVYEVAFLSTLDVNQTHLKPLEVSHLAFISFIRLFNTRVQPVNVHVATQPTPLTLDGMADTWLGPFWRVGSGDGLDWHAAVSGQVSSSSTPIAASCLQASTG